MFGYLDGTASFAFDILPKIRWTVSKISFWNFVGAVLHILFWISLKVIEKLNESKFLRDSLVECKVIF